MGREFLASGFGGGVQQGEDQTLLVVEAAEHGLSHAAFIGLAQYSSSVFCG